MNTDYGHCFEAPCGNDLDLPVYPYDYICGGTLHFGAVDDQAKCDRCGAWCGRLVAFHHLRPVGAPGPTDVACECTNTAEGEMVMKFVEAPAPDGTLQRFMDFMWEEMAERFGGAPPVKEGLVSTGVKQSAADASEPADTQVVPTIPKWKPVSRAAARQTTAGSPKGEGNRIYREMTADDPSFAKATEGDAKASKPVKRPMTDDEKLVIPWLVPGRVRYTPGSWDKMFARDIQYALNPSSAEASEGDAKASGPMITEAQSAQVWRIFWRYRRQIGAHQERERLLAFAQGVTAKAGSEVK